MGEGLLYDTGIRRLRCLVNRRVLCYIKKKVPVLNNTPTKYNKYFVNQKLEHFDHVIFRDYFKKQSDFNQIRFDPFFFFIYVHGHSFYEIQLN
jgi:hypothetical protein